MPVILKRTKTSPADPLQPHGPRQARTHYAAEVGPGGVVTAWDADVARAAEVDDADAKAVARRWGPAAGRLDVLDSETGKVQAAVGADAVPVPPKPAGDTPEVKKLRADLAEAKNAAEAADDLLRTQAEAAEAREKELAAEAAAAKAEAKRLAEELAAVKAAPHTTTDGRVIPKGGSGSAPPK